MLLTPTIRDQAHELLLEGWRTMPLTSHASGEVDPGHCPVAWVMDDLLELLTENHGKPAESLRPMIRRMILERAYLDNVAALGFAPPLEEQVNLTVIVLEQVRQSALDRGQWSEQQPAPQMCG